MSFSYVRQTVHIWQLFGSQFYTHHLRTLNLTITFLLMPIVIILSFDDWGHRWGVHELFLCLAYARARYEQEFSLDTPTFTIWEMDKFMEDICDITLESTANKTFDVTMESGSEWHLDTSFPVSCWWVRFGEDAPQWVTLHLRSTSRTGFVFAAYYPEPFHW